jgi:hypothetical protein
VGMSMTTSGALVGTAQSVALRRSLRGYWWLPATWLGWGLSGISVGACSAATAGLATTDSQEVAAAAIVVGYTGLLTADGKLADGWLARPRRRRNPTAILSAGSRRVTRAAALPQPTSRTSGMRSADGGMTVRTLLTVAPRNSWRPGRAIQTATAGTPAASMAYGMVLVRCRAARAGRISRSAATVAARLP